ncbi:Glucosamine 6-phosphate N-acetyltransferase [Capsicum annuum]|nr:Glucosamine 6-phosphate N-acetyltransferase [Capsicum annuum]
MMQHQNPVEDAFHIRKLEISDKEKGFIELLRQLTVCDSVSDEKFNERFEEIAKYGDDHRICVIEDVRSGKIVATGSVFIEKKFVRNCGKAGHIEDVVVDSSARGLQLGKRIVEYLADHAHSMGCYKLSVCRSWLLPKAIYSEFVLRKQPFYLREVVVRNPSEPELGAAVRLSPSDLEVGHMFKSWTDAKHIMRLRVQPFPDSA